MLKVSLAAFAVACSWGLPDTHEYSGYFQMALYLLDKQTAVYNSPHNWLMSYGHGFSCFVWCGGENGTNGCHLTGFSEDVTFAHHLVAIRLSPPSCPVGVPVVQATSVKHYLKCQAIQLAIYSIVGEYTQIMNSNRIVANFMQVPVSFPERDTILQIQVKSIFLDIYNRAWLTVLL